MICITMFINVWLSMLCKLKVLVPRISTAIVLEPPDHVTILEFLTQLLQAPAGCTTEGSTHRQADHQGVICCEIPTVTKAVVWLRVTHLVRFTTRKEACGHTHTKDSVAGIALAMPISEIAQNIDNHSRSQLYLAYAELDGLFWACLYLSKYI